MTSRGPAQCSVEQYPSLLTTMAGVFSRLKGRNVFLLLLLPAFASVVCAQDSQTTASPEPPCVEEPSIAQRDECLINILSAFYGPKFVSRCPTGSIFFATQQCTGCPWDNLPRNTLMIQKNDTNPADDGCRVADYLGRFIVEPSEWLRSLYIPILVGTLLFTSMLSLAFVENRLVGKAKGIREPLYMFLLWFLFLVYAILLAMPATVFAVCESNLGLIAHLTLRDGAYITLFVYSVYRCLVLPSPEEPGADANSWLSFALGAAPAVGEMNGDARWDKYVRNMWKTSNRSMTRQRIACVYLALATALMALNIILTIFVRPDRFERGDMCRLSSTDHREVGILQYVKVFLQIFALVAYAFGPQLGLQQSIVRMSALVLILACSITASILHGVWGPPASTTLLPGVLDAYIAGNYVELFRTFAEMQLGRFFGDECTCQFCSGRLL